MLPVRELPRPTVRQIMAMPFPNEAYVEKQRKRLEGKRPRRKARDTRWLLVVPAERTAPAAPALRIHVTDL